jgi:hypothetical protein
MQYRFEEVALQLEKLVAEFELCSNLKERNHLESEIRALQMVVTYYHTVALQKDAEVRLRRIAAA